MSDLISIVVPSYNVEDYIDKCVDSICHQNYENIEIILVDDGATDGTGTKCDEWAGRNARIQVIHQENQGLSGARNAGIRASKGKYISFIDSDDMIAPDYVSTLYSCITENGTRMAQGLSKNFFKEEDIAGFVSRDDRRVVSGYDMCKTLMSEYKMGWGIVMTKMFEKSLFDELEFPLGHIHEDEYLVYKLYWNAGQVALTDKIVYYYRSKRKGSITHSGYSLNHLDAVYARQERCEFFKDLGEKELYQLAKLGLCTTEIENLKKLKESDVEDKDSYIDKIEQDLRANLKEIWKAEHISAKKKVSLWMARYMPGLKGILKK
ncbi:glycosyl transferase GT2 family [Butyrivibrio proteoclasticus B316]|uniref:Glycosyl transferase GT2 family n=1 Tax=Butyrivibrio proteoclasticus (strain ATCC 51982 / DSM 14932 / B316) TaxID=515622 RepID=E0S001_BUTPB|nr:glycosyltransferase family A protein [Butyrivibrio proteoclasticus]ADL33202.1 glycosyl transferase GT2 family [Butyrivibrio proteoclasticus B316]